MRIINPKLLGIHTTFPTLEGTPADDATDVRMVKLEKKTKTSVWWPDNWHKLTPKWRAELMAHIIHKIIGSFLQGCSPSQATATFEAFRKRTGWGGPDEAKKSAPEPAAEAPMTLVVAAPGKKITVAELKSKTVTWSRAEARDMAKKAKASRFDGAKK